MRLIATDRIKEAVQLCKEEGICEIENDLPEPLEWIPHSTLIEVSKKLAPLKGSAYSLGQLLRGSGAYITKKPPPPPKSPEFLAQMERLRLRQEELEYQQLIRGPERADSNEAPISFGAETKQLREQISAIVNVLISVASMATALWYWTRTSAPGWSLSTRTLVSIFGGLVVLIAEVFIYLRYKIRIDEARETEIRVKEKRSVVSHFEYGGSAQSDDEPAEVPVPTVVGSKSVEEPQSVRKRK